MKRMKVWPKNFKAYLENRSYIQGIAVNATHIAYEYISKSGKFRDLVVIEPKSHKIWHTCPAVGHGRPCWHLAAAADICKWSLPMIIDVVPERYPNTLYNLQDITMQFKEEPGNFEIIDVAPQEIVPHEPEVTSEVAPEKAEPEKSSPELHPEDAWLDVYGIPRPILEKVLAFREAQKEMLTHDQSIRVPKPRYVPSGKELITSIAALLYGGNGTEWEAPLLVGPKGSGKSTLAETLAAILHMPVQKLFGGVDVNAEYLLGSKTLTPTDNGVDLVTEAKLRAAAKAANIKVDNILDRLRDSQLQVSFEPGILLQAVQNGEMVILDEVNMVVPEVTSLLHGLLDWQKTVSVPGLGTTQAHPSFRLVAAMNYGYSGTRDLNEAFQDRFRSVLVPHLPKDALQSLLQQQTGCTSDKAEELADLFGKLAARVENGDLSERCLSVRALIRAIREHQDGVGTLKEVTLSVLTEGLGDRYEAEQVKDVVDACLI